jgi:hypothetical protein
MARNKKYYNLDKAISGDSNYKSAIITIVVVLLVIGLFYLFAVYITSKPQKIYVPEESISYEQITAGSTFNMSDSEYIVLFYSRENNTEITDKISNYKTRNNIGVYYVDLDDAINNTVISNTSNKEATKASELKVTNPTIIRIKNGKITDYVEGQNNVVNYIS